MKLFRHKPSKPDIIIKEKDSLQDVIDKLKGISQTDIAILRTLLVIIKREIDE